MNRYKLIASLFVFSTLAATDACAAAPDKFCVSGYIQYVRFRNIAWTNEQKFPQISVKIDTRGFSGNRASPYYINIARDDDSVKHSAESWDMIVKAFQSAMLARTPVRVFQDDGCLNWPMASHVDVRLCTNEADCNSDSP